MRRPGPYDLCPEDMVLLAEVAPDFVAAVVAGGFPNAATHRKLLESWWRQATGWGRGPQARTGPLPEALSARASDGVPTWWLRPGFGILEGRAAGVYAVYAQRVHENGGLGVPLALAALSARLLLVGDVRVLGG